VVERGWVRTTGTRASFHKRLATPSGVDRYTLIREHSSGEGFTILLLVGHAWWRYGINPSAVLVLWDDLALKFVPSLHQKWGILGTHNSYRRSMELVRSGCAGGGLLSFLALIKITARTEIGTCAKTSGIPSLG